jgi:hypothetical protein
MEIYKKLLEIQKSIKGLSKDKKSHNYDYVTGNKLLSFIKPLMDQHGLILKQEITSIENTRQDYKTKYGEKSEVLSKVMMKFTWIDCETGETDINTFGANGQNDWEKGLGSALTYGERYFLLKYFHIATDEDDIDNAARKTSAAVPIKQVDYTRQNTRLTSCDSMDQLAKVYKSFTPVEQKATYDLKEQMKTKLS